jgi:hypothetical protein
MLDYHFSCSLEFRSHESEKFQCWSQPSSFLLQKFHLQDRLPALKISMVFKEMMPDLLTCTYLSIYCAHLHTLGTFKKIHHCNTHTGIWHRYLKKKKKQYYNRTGTPRIKV